VFGEVVAVDICICDVVTPAERSALEVANTIDDLCWDLALLARSRKNATPAPRSSRLRSPASSNDASTSERLSHDVRERGSVLSSFCS
jgi:hypothetical protein